MTDRDLVALMAAILHSVTHGMTEPVETVKEARRLLAAVDRLAEVDRTEKEGA